MLRVQRALLAELLLLFGLTLAITTSVVFAGFMLYLVTETEGLAAEFLLDLLAFLVPVALSYSIPFSWLAAMAMVVGRMQAENEITALRATGMHLRTLVAPVTAVSAILALGAMSFNAFVVPASQRNLKAGMQRYVPLFLNSLKGVRRSLVVGDGRLSFDGYEPADGTFRDIELDRRSDDGALQQKVIAGNVAIRRLPSPEDPEGKIEFSFREGFILVVSPLGGPEMQYQEPTARIQTGYLESIGASTIFNESFGTSRYLGRPKEMTAPELLYAVERGGVYRANERDGLLHIHQRLSLGAAPLAMGLFALAVALLLPPGGRRVRDFLVCFLPAVLLFFPMYLAGGSVAKAGLPVWLGLWAPNLILVGAATVLLGLAFRK